MFTDTQRNTFLRQLGVNASATTGGVDDIIDQVYRQPTPIPSINPAEQSPEDLDAYKAGVQFDQRQYEQRGVLSRASDLVARGFNQVQAGMSMDNAMRAANQIGSEETTRRMINSPRGQATAPEERVDGHFAAQKDKHLQDYLTQIKEMEGYEGSPLAAAVASAESAGDVGSLIYGEGFGDMLGNLGHLATAFTAESLPAMGESVAGAIGGGLIGGLPGAMAGMGLGSANSARRSQLAEELSNKFGVNIASHDALSAALDDKEIRETAQANALKYGAAIGAVEAATMGVAGRMVARPGAGLLRRLGEVGKQTGVGVIGGGAGEAAGLAASGNEITAGAIAAEALGEMGGGVTDVGAALLAKRQAPANARDDLRQNESDMLDSINNRQQAGQSSANTDSLDDIISGQNQPQQTAAQSNAEPESEWQDRPDGSRVNLNTGETDNSNKQPPATPKERAEWIRALSIQHGIPEADFAGMPADSTKGEIVSAAESAAAEYQRARDEANTTPLQVSPQKEIIDPETGEVTTVTPATPEQRRQLVADMEELGWDNARRAVHKKDPDGNLTVEQLSAALNDEASGRMESMSAYSVERDAIDADQAQIIERQRKEEEAARPLDINPDVNPNFDDIGDDIKREKHGEKQFRDNESRLRYLKQQRQKRQAAKADDPNALQGELMPLDTAANEAATSPSNDRPEPTQAQKEAGNYAVGRVQFHGLNISVENPAGSQRKGTDAAGKEWSTTMAHHYGYIRGTEGADGDHVDTFIKPGAADTPNLPVVVVDQIDPNTGKFDEHKVVMGASSEAEAREIYSSNYDKDWQGLGNLRVLTQGQFKHWIATGNTKKPIAKQRLKKAEKQQPITGGAIPAATTATNAAPAAAQGAPANQPEFTPTHEDSMGNPLRETDEPGVYIDPEGFEVEDDGAVRIAIPSKNNINNLLSKEDDSHEQRMADEQQRIERPGQGRVGRDGGDLGRNVGRSIPHPSYVKAGRVDQSTDPKGAVSRRAEDDSNDGTTHSARLSERNQQLPISGNDSQVGNDDGGARESDLQRADPLPSSGGGNDASDQVGRSAKLADKGKKSQRRSNPVPNKKSAYTSVNKTVKESVTTEDKATAQKKANKREAIAKNTYGKDNKTFKASDADKARELLRKKLGQLNSGLDPEMIQAGITLAGFHVEAGARSFTDYSAKMVEDLGENARPYLKSWYNAVRDWPGFDAHGMTAYADLDSAPTKNDSKILSAQEAPQTASGKASTTVYTSKGSEVSVQGEVVELDSLIISNDDAGHINADYPPELQPRDRTRTSSELQIAKLAGELNPELLGDTRSASEGAPIVGDDGVVESGNGRSMAIRRVYTTTHSKAGAYRDFVINQAKATGGQQSADKAASMKQPVYIRRRVSDIDRATFAREANQSGVAAMSATELAQMDAQRIRLDLIRVDESSKLLGPANQRFVQAFLQEIGSSEAAGLVSSDGSATLQLEARLQAAIFAAAYDSPALVAMAIEETDSDIRNVLSALSTSAPDFAQARSDDPTLGDTDAVAHLVDGIELIRESKRRGNTVQQQLDQADMFDQPPPETVMFALFLSENQRKLGILRDSLKTFAKQLHERIIERATSDMFGGGEVDLNHIIGKVNKELDERHGEDKGTRLTGDLFDEPPEIDTREHEDPAPDAGRELKASEQDEPGPGAGDNAAATHEQIQDVNAKYARDRNLIRNNEQIDEYNQLMREHNIPVAAASLDEIDTAIKAGRVRELGSFAFAYPLGDAEASVSHRFRDARSYAYGARRDFVQFMYNTRSEALALAETDAQSSALMAATLALQNEYFSNEPLPASAAVVSSHIAGKSKFNAKQAKKRGIALDKANVNFSQWAKAQSQALVQAVKDTRTEEQKQQDTAKASSKKQAKLARQKKSYRDNAELANTMKRGDTVAGMQVLRVSKDREGYPKSFTVDDSADPLTDNKFDIEKTLGFPNKETYRQYVDEVRADQNAATAPASPSEQEADSSPYQRADKLVDRLYGDEPITADELRAGHAEAINNAEAIKAEINGSGTVPELRKKLGGWPDTSLKKAEIVDRIFKQLTDSLIPNRPDSYFMGQKAEKYGKALASMTDQDIADYREARAKRVAEFMESREKALNPETLADFRNALSIHGHSKWMTPEQRDTLDRLVVEERLEREAKQPKATTALTGETRVIAGEHTKKGHKIWTVQTGSRVSREAFVELKAEAKALGGYYSSYKGGGATPGFVFKDEASANALHEKLSGEQSENAEGATDEQSGPSHPLEQLSERLSAKADEILSVDRKANTHRRAGIAAAMTERGETLKARSETAKAIAKAVAADKAPLLQHIRHDTELQELESMLERARHTAKGKSDVRAEEFPLQREHIREVTWPELKIWRSQARQLARKLDGIDGAKKLIAALKKIGNGQQKQYVKWLKANPDKLPLLQAHSKNTSKAVVVGTAAEAERIRSNIPNGSDWIVHTFGRGKHALIMAPDLAVDRKIWDGEQDEQVSIHPDDAKSIARKLGKQHAAWQLESRLEKRARLERIGLTGAHDLREALRQYFDLRNAPAMPSKLIKLQSKLVGNKDVGVDFFPTPSHVAADLVARAGIKPGMATLEPNGGDGRIADAMTEAGVTPDVVELSSTLREILEEKGHNVVGEDFLEHAGQYDAITMNPPFSNGMDIEHVMHAFDQLKPGGKVVAIMSEGPFFRTDKKAEAFRDWLAERNGWSEKLPENTFKDPSLPVTTGVNARIVEIEKTTNSDGNTGDVLYSRARVPETATKDAAKNDKATGATPADVRNWVGKRQRGINRMINSGELNIVATASDLPGNHPSDVQGAVIGGKVYLVAENLTRESVDGVLLHEIGVHRGLKDMVGGRAWRGILNDIRALRDKGNKQAQAAYDRVPSDTAKGMMDEEALAYLVEESPRLPVVRRIKAAIRAALRAMGLAREYTPDDMVRAAQGALRRESLAGEASVAPAYSRSEPITKDNMYDRLIEDAKTQDLYFHGSKGDKELDSVNEGTGVFGVNFGGVFVSGVYAAARSHGDNMYAIVLGLEDIAESRDLDGIDRDIAIDLAGDYFTEDRDRLAEIVEAAIDDDDSLFADYDDDGESSWALQALRGAIAKKLGYKAVEMLDEHGTSYLVLPGAKMHRINEESGAPKYSRAATAKATVIEAVQDFDAIRKKVTSGKHTAGDVVNKTVLATLTRRQWVEVAKGVVPRLQKYLKDAYQMEAEQTEEKAEADKIANRWAKWSRENKAESEKLVALMHAATISGVDPDTDYVELTTEAETEALVKKVNTKVKIYAADRRKSGNDIKNLYAERVEAQNLLKQEQNRAAAKDAIQKAWKALSPDAQRNYRRVRDYHKRQHKSMVDALIKRIDESVLDARERSGAIAKIREQFESQEVTGPYFPLARFGQHVVTTYLDTARTDRRVDFFETEGAAREWEAAQREAHGDVERKKLSDVEMQAAAGLDEQSIQDIHQVIDGWVDPGTARDGIHDALQQLYLQALPSMSARKHFIHRANVKGYSEDAIRAFADTTTHNSNYLGKLKHGHQMQRTLEEAERDYEAATDSAALTRTLKEKQEFSTFRDQYLMDNGQHRADAAEHWRKQTSRLDNQMTATQHNARTAVQHAELREHRRMMELFKRFGEGLQGEAAVNRSLESIDQRLDTVGKIKSDPNNISWARGLLDEAKRSHQDVMNPNTPPWVQAFSQLGFFMYLGFSPIAAAVNMTQVPMVSLPLLGARYGTAAAAKELAKASKQVGGNWLDFRKTAKGGLGKGRKGYEFGSVSMVSSLKGEDKKAFRELQRRGVFEKSQAHDLMGMSESGDSHTGLKSGMMKASGYMFHQAEAMNRQITGMAAYRLARKAGKTHEQSIDEAMNQTYDTQGDYASSNRARVMRAPTVRVLTQFKQYAQFMTYLNVQAWKKSFGKADKETKAEARKMLVGLNVMQVVFGGTASIFGASSIGWVMETLANAMSDEDDEPMDWRREYRGFLAHILPNHMAHAVADGVVDAYTPAKLSSRVSIGELWWRSPMREIETTGDFNANLFKNIAGPTIGGIPEKMFRAYKYGEEGDLLRAIETALPTGMGNPLKATRMATEGVTTRAGNEVMAADEYGTFEALLQAAGMGSSNICERW